MVLHKACAELDWVSFLQCIAEGENPDSFDILGETPLSYCIKHAYQNESIASIIIESLLIMGANANLRQSESHLSPLMLAVLMNQPALVVLLLKYNANPNDRYLPYEEFSIPYNSTAFSICLQFTTSFDIAYQLCKVTYEHDTILHAIKLANPIMLHFISEFIQQYYTFVNLVV